MRLSCFGLFLPLLFSLGCTDKNKLDYGLLKSETIVVNLEGGEPPTLDWSKAADTTSSHVLDNLMEGLTTFDFKDPELAVLPALAKSWSVSKDAKVWTFKLLESVKWSDGKKLVAQHFVDSWIRLLAPSTASKYSYYLFVLKNAQEFNAGKLKNASDVGVKAVDDFTLQVTLKTPMAFFPSILSHTSTYPIRLDVIKKHGDKWTEPENMVTLGAYKLVKWEHDKALVLKANDSYYGKPAKIKNILFYTITELSTALNLFDSGKLDFMGDVPTVDLSVLKKRKEYHGVGGLIVQYYGINTKKKPMDNPLVRKAISQAIDRSQITKILAAGQIPANSFVPAGMFGYDPDRGLKFNVEKSKAALKKSGFTPKTIGKIQIGFNTNENHARVAENIQAQLKNNLGIEVELKNEEWKSYLQSLRYNAPHIYRMGWVADYPDPDNFLNLLTSYSSNNHTKWGNKNFDALIEKAVGELNKEKRKKLYSEAQKILTEQDVPIIPLYFAVNKHMISKRVKNFVINGLDRKIYKDVELSE